MSSSPSDLRPIALMAALCAALVSLPACRAVPPAPPASFELRPRQMGTGADPSLAIRDTGYIFLLQVAKGDLWFAISTNGGDSFASPVRVNNVAGEVMSHPEATPRVVQRAGRPYVLWGADEGGAHPVMKLRFARSTNYGASFSPAIDVDARGAAEQSFYNLALAPDGTIFAVWLDGRDKQLFPDGASVYVARSTDGGATFAPSVRVATNACPCCRPALAFGDASHVYVGFRKIYSGNIRDIAVAASADGGLSWGAPVRVAQDDWQLDGCPHSGPSLARLGPDLLVAWFSVPAGGRSAGVYVARSADGGRSFSAAELLSAGAVDVNHPQLVSSGHRVVAVFQGRDPHADNGWGLAHVYLRTIDDQGRLSPLVTAGNLGASASYPFVAFEAPTNIFLAWTETNSDATAVAFQRGHLLVPAGE